MIPLKLQKEQPGYILNSLLVPFLSAAEALLATGVADCETIDKTCMLATGAPLGPFRILDIVGLTTAYSIGIMDPRSKDPSTVQGKVAALLKAISMRAKPVSTRARASTNTNPHARSSSAQRPRRQGTSPHHRIMGKTTRDLTETPCQIAQP